MKRFFSHPSLPLVLGLVAILVAGLLLAISALLPNLFKAKAAGEKLEDMPQQTVSAVIPEQQVETSTSAVSGSYVLEVRDQFIRDKKTFIEADLTNMNLKVYKDGEINIDVPIKSKGKEGSWWETPVGVYSVKNKEPSHFSSFGHVYQPWSLVFQGNFFIHGWPYHPDNTPVAAGYSGGCIRLSDENAKLVYDAVEVTTPVLVYKAPVIVEPLPTLIGDPEITNAYTIVDVATGNTIRARDAGADIEMGPSINLLTALTTVDYINVESNVSVNELGSERLTGINRISVLDLLRLLLAENDASAADALASIRGQKTFVGYMNAKAAAIGMRHTVINSVDSTDNKNRTTLSDMALLARYLAQNRSFVLQLTKTARGNTVYDPPIWDDLHYASELLTLPGFRGGTGGGAWSDVVALSIPIEGKNRDVIVVGSTAEEIKNAVTWLSR